MSFLLYTERVAGWYGTCLTVRFLFPVLNIGTMLLSLIMGIIFFRERLKIKDAAVLLLYRCGYVVGRYISIESKIEKTKSKYYEVLERSGVNCHENNNNPEPFIKYILGIILSAYRDFGTLCFINSQSGFTS